MERRTFFKILGAVSGSTLIPRESKANGLDLHGSDSSGERDDWAVLVDTTRCEGCRMCEYACAEANGLPEPEADDETAFAVTRDTTPSQWSVIQRNETDRGTIFAKRQCMHCESPACAAACLTKAMEKTPEGPVIWHPDRCMGCRFCMLSCPFDVPKFEYDSWNPRISKCRMCWERLEDGQVPACVENCPAEALVFGRRSDLIVEARRRIALDPDTYVTHIYGEREAGGTSFLYLSSVPFEQLGFRTDLGEVAYPEMTRGFLTSVPVVLLVWPAFLLGLAQASQRAETVSNEEISR